MISKRWLFFTSVFLIFSLITKQVPLFMVTLLFFLAGGIARLWDRYSLNRVEYHRHLSSNRVFFGEKVEMQVEVSNRKPLPLPWLQLEDQIPNEVTMLKGDPSPIFSTTHQLLTVLFSLSWYHKVKRYYPIECLHRGYFTFGPAKISSGDVFGFFTRYQDIEMADHLMVYPKMVPLEKLGIPSRQPLGEIRTRNHLFHDPVLMMGIREYQSGDSLKSIDWKSTARTGRLQTRIFEPTTTVDMGIFLDVRTVSLPYWSVITEKLELAIVTAASIANQALSEGYRVGLYVNKNNPNSLALMRVPPSRHPEQLKHILEELALIQPVEVTPIAQLVGSESRNLPWGSTLVVISAAPSEPLLSALFQMQRVGRKVVLITIGGSGAINSNGLTTYNVSEDIAWEKMETLRLGTGR
jgi:uncharacterized protein (DUF58 family)